MVLGSKSLRSGFIKGLGNIPALGQGAASTAVAYTATGAIKDADTVVDINSSGTVAAMTIPSSGFDVGRILVITQIDAGTDGHTVTLTPTGATFDGTNNTATLNAQYEALVLVCISDKRFLILKNYGSVALSAV
jgi:hypothetical protein